MNFPRLVDGRHGHPKKRTDLQMLLLSAVLSLNLDEIYSESQINEKLGRWIARFASNLTIDHVTLRRYLVDESILQRDQFGTSYSLANGNPHFSFDTSIKELDLDNLVAQYQKNIADRKQTYLAMRKQT